MLRSRAFGRLTVSILTAISLGSAAPFALAADPPTYRCQGFDEPMNRSPQQIGRGRVLPLRAKLVLPDGTFGDDDALTAAPMIVLKYQPESGPEVDKSDGVEVRDYGKGKSFVFDKEAHWKFDLGTGNLPDDGKYTVSLRSGNDKEYKVDPTCSLVFNLHGGG